MQYEISIPKSRTYIKIRVLGDITAQLQNEFTKKAIRTAHRHSINRYLVDVRNISNISGIYEQYQFGYEELNLLELDKNAVIAVVTDADNASHNFIETVLYNAGYACRMFTDMKSAIRWITTQR